MQVGRPDASGLSWHLSGPVAYQCDCGPHEVRKRDPMMTDLAQLWATSRASLRQQVPEPTWNTYLAPLVLLEGGDSQFVVGAPNSMILERVATRYQGMIQEALGEASCADAVK